MARPKKEDTNLLITESDDIAKDLIRDINKEFSMRMAYNLSDDTAPTTVKQWISSRSLLLDYAMANKRGGGYPGGRIIEISGLPSTGKSHLAYEAARSTQEAGGLVVYIDTENATPVDKLAEMGIDVTKRFVYVDTHCTEEIFTIIDSVIRKSQSIITKGLPVLVIWDSIANSSPKAELEGDYDAQTMGLQARALAKGFRKLTGVLGQTGVTLMCINQLKCKMNASPYSDPYTTPGGMAIPFASTIRIRLTGEGTQVKDLKGNVVGIKVPLKVIKNKVAPPFRNFPIEIHFGKGIIEHETLLDLGIEYCLENKRVERNNKYYSLSGKGCAWKTFMVSTKDGEILFEKKMTKNDFVDCMKDEAMKVLLLEFFDGVLTYTFGNVDATKEIDLNPKSENE